MKKMLFAAIALTVTNQLYAADPVEGQKKAKNCIACHGLEGNDPILETYPKLGGQNAAYLEASIKAYKNGERTGVSAETLMVPMISALTDEDIADIAAYFNSVE